MSDKLAPASDEDFMKWLFSDESVPPDATAAENKLSISFFNRLSTS